VGRCPYRRGNASPRYAGTTSSRVSQAAYSRAC
jgi:hypothetical protein